jgi:hypothetical protein
MDIQHFAHWTLELMEDAKAKHQFIMVTNVGLSRVYIIDVHRLWMINPRIVFQTGYRIAGTPEDIRSVLIVQGITDEDIQALIESSITTDNYTNTMSPIYNDEIRVYDTWKRAAIKSNVESPGFKLFDIMAAVNPEVLQKIRLTKQEPAQTATGRGKGRGVKSLVEKLAALPAGKVLDVSSLDQSGAGTRAIDPPTRAKKFGSPNLPLVSSDIDHYVLAISMLPGGQEKYAADIQYVRNLFAQGRGTGAILTLPGQLPILPPTLPPPTVPTQLPQGQTPVPPVTRPDLFQVPHVDDGIIPTGVAPIYTQAQRKKIKDAAAKAALAKQGLPVVPRSPQLPVLGQPIITPYIAQTPATQPPPLNPVLGQNIVIPKRLQEFNDEESDDKDEISDEDEFYEGEPSDEDDFYEGDPSDEDEFYEGEPSDQDDFAKGGSPLQPIIQQVPVAPVVPTLPANPVVPTLPANPVVPTLTTNPVVPTLPANPVVPTLTTNPVVPTLPTMFPVIPGAVLSPQTRTIPSPVIANTRYSPGVAAVIPQVKIGVETRLPTIPTLPMITPLQKETPAKTPRSPMIPVLKSPFI